MQTQDGDQSNGFPVSTGDGISRVLVSKELSVVEAVPFRNAVRTLCEASECPMKLVLDFSRTSFLDSSGIGALASCMKMSQANGIALVVTEVRPEVRSVLAMTGLDKVLTIESDDASREEESAVDAGLLPVTHPSVRSKAKRVIDVLGSLVGLGITALLFIPIAIAIKRDSPGPILFNQTRCGWMGRRFKLWKFRSMVPDAEARRGEIRNEAEGAIFKAENDPRITKAGRFLRRTSLDELPQFWNVLQGSMSLVGTRPPTPDEIDQYDVPEWRRLDVKPGITGEWQVNGRSSIKSFEDIIRLDLRYQRNWSLWYDIKLMLKTILVVFNKDSGAM
ncbi:anti-sigma factor antagonist [Marichromatium bheemlicum]|uniref:Anti-sigma factor antagonist n=1 Tax=Marichromatium bheemlicum TaxID=365339 RepID=A0ABX1I7N6_9GAMM|nr:anti-sigma factor antagonist [Marichromatium bheemlicum]NKN33592.1 anti-sigma factor antagonist [Marichromatium bheemlicum]